MVALHKIADHQLKELPSGGEFKLKEEEEEEDDDDEEESNNILFSKRSKDDPPQWELDVTNGSSG